MNGSFVEVTPTHAVVECQGVGDQVFISLQTYDIIQSWKQGKLLVHQIIREDAHQLFGFAEERERDMFRLLIGVSGVYFGFLILPQHCRTATPLRHALQWSLS